MRHTKLIAGVVKSAFAACGPMGDAGPRESSSPRDHHALLTNTFVVTHIPIPYPLVANFGSLSGLTYDPSDDSWWTHDDNRSGTVTYPTIFNFRIVGGAVQVVS